MTANAGINMTTNVGINMTANVGIHMTTNVGIYMTTSVGPRRRMCGRNFRKSWLFPDNMEFSNLQAPPKFSDVPFFRYQIFF